MTRPFIGSEALRSGEVTRHSLRRRFVALHPDVYAPPDVQITARERAYAAWLCPGARLRGLALVAEVARQLVRGRDPSWPPG